MIAAILFALPPVCLIAAALFVAHAARRVDATDHGYGEVQHAPKSPEEHLADLDAYSKMPGLSMREAADALAKIKAMQPNTAEVVGLLARWSRWKRRFRESGAADAIKILHGRAPGNEGESLVMRYRVIFGCNPPERLETDIYRGGPAGEKSRTILAACCQFRAVGVSEALCEPAAKGVWDAAFTSGGGEQEVSSLMFALTSTLHTGKFKRQDFCYIAQVVPKFSADMRDAAYGMPGKDWFEALSLTPDVVLEWFVKRGEA